MTHKLKWQTERMKPHIPFPHHIFWWMPPDCSKVPVYHTVKGYNEDVDIEAYSTKLECLEDSWIMEAHAGIGSWRPWLRIHRRNGAEKYGLNSSK